MEERMGKQMRSIEERLIVIEQFIEQNEEKKMEGGNEIYGKPKR